MRDILENCVRLDTFAYRTYSRLADAAEAGLKETLQVLAREERMHAEWWEELLRAWDAGLLPDIVTDSAVVADELDRRYEELRTVVPDDVTGLSPRELLGLAARLEFYMLLPVFGELIDLVEPGQARRRHSAYRHHLETLTRAIDDIGDHDPLVAFLADVLRRVADDNRALSSHATRDALTGLRNRRSLDGHLRQWLAWSSRYGRPLGVLLVDLDEFKPVNDRFGHAAGDETLRAAASVMEASVRGSDMVARYGGDEFVVVAPESGVAEIESLASRVLGAMRDVEIETEKGVVRPTVSVGAAVLMPGMAAPTPEGLLSAADQSLYGAKKAGRDRVGVTQVIGDPQAA